MLTKPEPILRGWRRLAAARLLLAISPLGFSCCLAQDFEFFEKRIRPVLIERCYKCHSAEAEKLKGGLLLDTRDGLLKGGESGQRAIVPGDAKTSRLIAAIRWHNEDLQMPPKYKLRDEQIDDFVAWVNSGAPDPRTNGLARVSDHASRITHHVTNHWAFLPPKISRVPAVNLTAWPKTPIDHFILTKLEDKGLCPSPPADKRILLRRATYDLTGLPPNKEDIEAFENDHSADAFAKVVERLLSSPHYGERWGRYWLDVARYSDTKGYVYGDREEARFVHSHVYRDWVVQAFNDDLPYDQFLLQQIAADQVPPTVNPQPATMPPLAAMGFLTLGRRFLGVVHDIIDDRIDVVMRGAQGLTMGCARCHDHKFDPIPIKDYYSLYGVFAGSTERHLPLASQPPRTESYLAYEKELQVRTDKLNQTFQKKREELYTRLRARTADYLLAVLDVAKLPSEEFYEIRGSEDLNPTVIRQWQACLFQTRKEFHAVFAPWHEYAALPEQDFPSKAVAVCEKLAASKDLRQGVNPLVLQAFANAPPISMRDVAQRYSKLLVEADKQWQEIAGTNTTHQPSTVNYPPSSLPDPNLEQLRQVLYGANSPIHVPPGAIVDVEWFFDEPTRVELGKLQAEIERWNIKAPGAPPHTVILADRSVQKNPRVFVRGNPANRGEEVPRQFLQVLAGPNRRPFQHGSGRLELAQAIASKDNPLTARVMVNRIWLHHFGAGLVRTPSDFGTRCEPPSHPELLDWLACRFMADGWSIKKLHRLIMLSSVYQQASQSSVTSNQYSVEYGRAAKPNTDYWSLNTDYSLRAATIDPENRLLWRMSRQRLDFEAMRDSLLAVSSQLDATIGGKSVELVAKSPNSSSKRRTIYTYIDRQFLPGVFRVFDFANPDMHAPQRYHTTVPQQALFFMNGPFVVEQARALASLLEFRSAEIPPLVVDSALIGRTKVRAPARAASVTNSNGRRSGFDSIKENEFRIREMYEQIYQREPTPRQLELGQSFVKAALAEPLPELRQSVVSVWHYGYGEFDEATQRVKNFRPLPHFTGDAWQGGPTWPDEKLGWVQLKSEGGHAGNDLRHAAIRRWAAPIDGTLSINGTLKHEHKEGDGIRARIVSNRAGQLGSWTLHNDKAETKFDSVEVKHGDTIDFVVDLNGNLNNDDFTWTPVFKVAGSAETAVTGDYPTEWNAKKDFSGPPQPPPAPLKAWEKYAQVLLLANEFLFVD